MFKGNLTINLANFELFPNANFIFIKYNIFKHDILYTCGILCGKSAYDFFVS